MVSCPRCGEPMPRGRLTLEVANGVCIECNRGRPRRTYVEGAAGFKNNGASVVPLEIAKAIKEANPVRG